MVNSQAAGVTLVIGLAGALWSASGYVGAFGRSLNRIYQVEEGRPIWKLRPVVLLITLGLVIMAALVLVGLVVSGPIAQAIGEAIGFGDEVSQLWDMLKWPVILGDRRRHGRRPLLRDPEREAPEVPVVSVGAAVAIGDLGAGLAGLRVLRLATSVGTTRSTGRSAASSSSCCGCGSPTSRCSFGAEIDAELRAGPRAAGRHPGRADPPAAAARHQRRRQGRGEAGRADRRGTPPPARGRGGDCGCRERVRRGAWRRTAQDETRGNPDIRAGAAPLGAAPRRARATDARRARLAELAGQRRSGRVCIGTYAFGRETREAHGEPAAGGPAAG